MEWGRLSLQRARYLLVNPLYAGAYVYARTHLQAVVGPDQRIARKPRPLAPADWGAVRWEAFPGYIDRAEYERNQACLASNQNRVTLAQRGCRRDGCALLSGLVLCGRCGKRMYVSYSGQASQHVTYLCNTASMRYAQPACQRVPGAAVDRLVAEHLLAALTPAQVELSLAVAAELERQQGELERQWQRRIEGARYAVRLAQRRYEQVDPENRLVARTLEQSWENALREVQQLEQAYARFRQQTVLQLSPPQREQLFHLAQDLAQVWQAPTTTWAERKNLLELLVADVTLTRLEHGIRVQIRWHTNQVEEYQLPLPTLGTPPTPAPLLKRIRELTPTHTDGEIAHLLNQEGLKTATGNALTTRIVGDTRRRNHIRKRPPPSEVDS